MALGEAQLVSSLYTPQRLGSIAQKLNGRHQPTDSSRKRAKNTRKHAKTHENTRKHAKNAQKRAKNTQNRPAIKRKTRKAPDKNSENLRKTRDSCHFYKNHILTVASRKNPALFPAFSGKMKNGFRPKYI